MRETIRDIDRLRHIDECIEHINDYLKEKSFEDMKADLMCFHAEGVSFVSSITLPTSSESTDGSEISLSHSYKVTVYAQKSGYIDSDSAVVEFKGSLIRGDLNNDGKVDVTDHVELSKIIMAP